MKSGCIENARIQGEYLLGQLRSLQKRYPVLLDARGRGLMVGIQFVRLKGSHPLMEGALVLWTLRQLFRKHSIVTAFTLNNFDVLRIAPPLNVTRREIDRFLNSLEDCLKASRLVTLAGLATTDRT